MGCQLGDNTEFAWGVSCIMFCILIWVVVIEVYTSIKKNTDMLKIYFTMCKLNSNF